MDEQARLAELQALDLLESGPEERFDRLTRLAADLFDYPVCLINLLTNQEVFVKSRVGLEGERMPRRETFCDDALGRPVTVIPDTQLDPVATRKAVAHGPNAVRGYASATIRGPNGHPVGTLCLLDYRPRELDERQSRQLRALADLVEKELAERRLLQEARERLEAEARFDPATGLPRAEGLNEWLQTRIDRQNADGGFLALCTMRFPRHDEVVLTYGQAAADELSRQIAERTRRACGSHGLASRLDRDRLAAAGGPFRDREQAVEWVWQLYRGLGATVAFGEGIRDVKVICGAALYPGDATDVISLVDRAQLTMETADAPGLHFYATDSEIRIQRRDRLGAALQRALETNETHLVYQPIFAADGRVTALEALARWHSSEFGSVSPGEFIPLAEGAPYLYQALTYWVLREAARSAVRWNADLSRVVPVNVNVGASALLDPAFADRVLAILAETGLAPDGLVVEITEQTLVDDLDHAVQVVERLNAAGIHVALDDFGTGYSSLSYLRAIPAQTLKIDRSFVRGLAEEQRAAELLRGIVSIGRSLGMSVVAEGVETREQHRMVLACGCDAVQGFLLARPMEEAALETLFNAA